jgi:hypothetical protein
VRESVVVGLGEMMDTQESYDAWARQMIDRHCRDLFTSVCTAEHNGVVYMQAVVDDPRGEKYRVSLSTYGRELTVECRAFHSHLDQFDEDNHEQEFLFRRRANRLRPGRLHRDT